ncbi:hypothetical protein HYT25_00340 [Candidatus Pacearchaeota archaeon]|nr:hypothetical protein [Candidatus Pacearchaeota archaeon]
MKIKKEIKELFSVWKDVFSNWKYLILGAIILFLFYSVNVGIANFSILLYYVNKSGLAEGINFFFNLFLGFRNTIPLSSFVSLIVLGGLFGMLFSLIAYKTVMIKNVAGGIGAFGTAGIFLGILAPGCAACGIGLLSLFGISAVALTFLPFNGLELSFLAMGILGFSVFKITRDINKGIVCEINAPLRKNEKLKGGKIR